MSLLKSNNNTGIIKLYMTLLLSQLRKKKTIALTFTLALLYSLFKKINAPPSYLRHLPYVSFSTFFKCIIADMPLDRYSKEIISPVLKKSPDAFVCPTVGYWAIMLTDPIAVKQFLMRADIFPKAEINSGRPGSLIHRFVSNPNIVMLSGDAWRRHRKIVNPAFNLSMPIGLFGEFTQVMFNTIDKLGSKVDVLTLFERLTLDVMGRYLLSFDFKALEDQENEWVSVYNSVKDGIMSPFFLVFSIFDTDWVHLFPKRAKAHDNMTRFLNMLDSIIEKKRLALKENKNRNQSLDAQDRDLLTMMIESEDGNGGAALSNEELRKNLCMFFLAGHDTTAFTLSFMVYELAKHPDVQEKARQEAIRILGDKPMDVLPTIEDIRKMTYINAVMKETMRLHNPLLATTTRQATEDCQLGSVYVPRGAFVCADMTNLHRNPKVWSSPYTFNPDRFLPGGEAERHPGSGLAWIPFSNGSRMCVGANFSMNEQRVVMSMLLRKFTWKLPSDSIHANGLITRGLAFSIISTTSLDINFEKRY